MAQAALELREILDAAERAAAAEDFVSAERHLRQAAILQERQLGAGHPDLANTLNNLGIVSEYVGKPADAEACYRRAYRIASAALPSDHPLVQTSGKNFREFCAAIGKVADIPDPVPPELESFAAEPQVYEPRLTPATAPPVPEASMPVQAPPIPQPPSMAQPMAPPPVVIRDLPLRSAEDLAPERPAGPETAAIRISSPVSPQSNRPTTTTMMAVVALLVLAAAAWWFGLREPSPPATAANPDAETVVPSQEPPPTTREEQAVPPEPPLTPASSSVAEPPALPVPTDKPPVAEVPTRAPTPVTEVGNVPPPAKTAATSSSLSVADAKVCRSLSTSDWACTPATNPAAPGSFVFYTRVRSASDTTVQHRWLADGRLVRNVSLRIRANPGAGYRTYSRNTVSAERRGNWTIELRDAGGALLREERFTVQ